MADLQKNFEHAVKFINSSKPGTVKLSNAQKLMFYALFKQATIGDCTGAQPGRMQMVARAKYDAWKEQSNKKLSKDDAMKAFIEEFKKVVP